MITPVGQDEIRFNEALGARIAARRRHLKISQAVLADAIGVPRTSMILIERGRQKVTAFMLAGLSTELELDLTELLGIEPNPLPAVPLALDAPDSVRDFVTDVRRAAMAGQRGRA